MDGYSYNRDPYRQASAGYNASSYPTSYGLERRSSSYGLPLSDSISSYGLERRSTPYGLPLSESIASYARIPIDPYASGYGAPASYQPEVFVLPRYASSAPDPLAFRSSPRPRPAGHKKKPPPPPPAQNLGPRKKQTQQVRFSEKNGRSSKQTQKVRFSEENGQSSQKTVQMKRAEKSDPRTGKAPRSQASSLAKETQELHSLYRTGVDSDKKIEEKKDDRKAASMKRKAETQMQKSTPDESAKKKQKQKKNKKFVKDKKSDSSPVVEKAAKAGRPPLTEEEKNEAEAALELQRGVSKSVTEFLGVPPVVEKLESKEAVDVSESDAKPEDSTEAEKPSKPEEPQRTPEEEKELEEKSFKFFSKLFEEHQDLRNLYIEKCNSGSFECLVCHSIDAERSKKFWNLISLVMHTSMRKKMQPEHRGYGHAVSAVLGWDPNKKTKVPRGSKHLPTEDKTTNQVKEDTKPETEDKTVDKEEKVADVNVPEEHQEENAAEEPSKDSIEE